MVNIKVIHKQAVRRFTLPSNATWIELEAKLRTLFSIPAFSPFTLSYTDEDNDVITLSTDSELQDILFSAPTVKFNLKFSTPDDSSDSEDSESNEVWVLEGGNILPHKRTASITKIETDTLGLQDNVSQNNITNLELQEPQFIEVDSRDKVEPSSNEKVPVDDDIEKVDENTHKVEEKKHQVNLLDDNFFESFNKLSTHIHETSIEDKQEIIASSDAFTRTSLEQDQSRQDPVVDLQQFQMMIERNQDAIKENPQLVASIKDVMDQIQQLDSFCQPITKSRKRNFCRPITPPIPGYTTHSLSMPQTPEFYRATTPPEIPGAYPKNSVKVVPWASQPPRNRSRGRRGHHYRQHYHNHNKRNHDINRDNNHDQEEKILDEKEETEETSESQETTDLRILYGQQIDTLTEMGYKDENVLVGLLIKHDGQLDSVINDLCEE